MSSDLISAVARSLDSVDAAEEECIFDHLGTTALDLYNSTEINPPIISFIKNLDDLLGGGIPLGCVTEICGCSCAGKTQLALQLTADVFIPLSLGGTGGKALYIDTQGDFSTTRLSDMVSAVLEHLHASTNSYPNLSFEYIMNNTTVVKCFDWIELLAVVHTLDSFIKDDSDIKLIVIDSIATVFRHVFNDDYVARARILCELMAVLRTVAYTHNVAIVVTNQLLSKYNDPNSLELIPALGETFGQYCANRLVIESMQNNPSGRVISLVKSTTHESGTAMFEIRKEGCRGV
ncbi:hypothetical protein GEMRC1_008061 [Eukaryota sp. GEM-RC1]